MTMTEILLLLYAVMLGTTFGAGLYEARIVIPFWFPQRPDKSYVADFDNQRKIDSGREFWGMITTGPLSLLTLANLYFAFNSRGAIQIWWLTASLIVLIERIITFSFFVPTLMKLRKNEDFPDREVDSLIFWWVRLNYLRNVSTLIALVFILRALTLTECA